MHTFHISSNNIVESIQLLGPRFAERAANYDRTGHFVADNYQDLRDAKWFSAMIPTELGGMGWEHSRVCDLIRHLAHYCGSTALAFSMHQHLIGASTWKYLHMGKGEQTLRSISKEQLVLVSTGARDWLG